MQYRLDRQLSAVLDLDPFDAEQMDGGYERLHRLAYPGRKHPQRLVGRELSPDIRVD
jgi:hypothetical protein